MADTYWKICPDCQGGVIGYHEDRNEYEYCPRCVGGGGDAGTVGEYPGLVPVSGALLIDDREAAERMARQLRCQFDLLIGDAVGEGETT